jgi:hypothetical protein
MYETKDFLFYDLLVNKRFVSVEKIETNLNKIFVLPANRISEL